MNSVHTSLQVQQLHTADILSEAYLLPIPKEYTPKMSTSDERLPSDRHSQ